MIKLKFYSILMTVLCTVSTCFAQVGINTTTPLSTLDINGNLTIKEVGILNANVPGSGPLFGGPSGSARPISDGVYISLTPTSGNQEFILPNAVNVPGRIYILRNISNSVDALIFTFGGSFFPKNSSNAVPASGALTLPFNSAPKTIIIISDGSNWTYIN